MIPQGFGAGVGRVGPYYEQGNWYRGGAVQMLFIAWLYGEQNQVRPMFPPNTTQEDLIRASKAFDLAQQLPPVDWSKALAHLPEMDIIKAVDGPHGIFADREEVSTGGAMIKRSRTIRLGIAAVYGTTACPSTCLASGSCPGMTCPSARTSPPITMSAKPRGLRSRTNNMPSSRPRFIAATSGPPKTPLWVSAAWATRGSTMTL